MSKKLQDTVVIEFNGGGSSVDHVAVASFDEELNTEEGELTVIEKYAAYIQSIYDKMDAIRNGEEYTPPDINTVTSFSPGDTIHVWLHLSSNVELTGFAVTDGAMVANGTSTRQTTDQVLFSSKELGTEGLVGTTHTTSVIPISTSVSVECYGNQGSPSRVTEEFGLLKFVGSDVANVPYIADISYSFSVQLFTITAPELPDLTEGESYPLGIVFYIAEK